MKPAIIKVSSADTTILYNILHHHIDESNREEVLPAEEHLRQMLNDDRTYLLAAIIEEEVAGYALAYRFPSLYGSGYLAYLYDISVAPPYRRSGIGTLLIQALKQYLTQDNVTELWLGTGVANTEGQALFSRTGAVKSEEVFNDYTYYL